MTPLTIAKQMVTKTIQLPAPALMVLILMIFWPKSRLVTLRTIMKPSIKKRKNAKKVRNEKKIYFISILSFQVLGLASLNR